MLAQENESLLQIDQFLTKAEFKCDSLEIKSSDADAQKERILFLNTFFNKVLLRDNYRDKDRLSEIIAEFEDILPSEYKYSKMYNNTENINILHNAIIFKEKYALLKIYRKERDAYYDAKIELEKNKINDLENRISWLLAKGNIKFQDFQKLTDDQQQSLIIELDQKYKKP